MSRVKQAFFEGPDSFDGLLAKTLALWLYYKYLLAFLIYFIGVVAIQFVAHTGAIFMIGVICATIVMGIFED